MLTNPQNFPHMRTFYTCFLVNFVVFLEYVNVLGGYYDKKVQIR